MQTLQGGHARPGDGSRSSSLRTCSPRGSVNGWRWCRAAGRLERSVAALTRLYAAGERDEIAEAEILRRREVILRQLDPTGRTNNAVILARRDYLGDLAGFECALGAQEGSLSERIRQIAARARAASDPWSTLPQCPGAGGTRE